LDAGVEHAQPRPIERPARLHASVRESLQQLIAARGLKPGDALPPETALARSLGVSRNSLREATKALESVGVLEARHGTGIFVREFSFGPLIEYLGVSAGHALTDLADILDVRRTLETGLIGEVITRIGAKDLAALDATLAAMRRRAAAGEPFPEEDQAFHAQLFACLDNRVLLSVLDVFWRAFHRAVDLRGMDDHDPMQTWADHDAIVAAVRQGNADAARQQLDAHYHGIRERLLSSRPPGTPP
jgi:DNA-binding FadR family transcriptional regulator